MGLVAKESDVVVPFRAGAGDGCSGCRASDDKGQRQRRARPVRKRVQLVLCTIG